MTTTPGWYTDPGGSGQFRWWDGSRWSEALSPHPTAPPPASRAGASGAGASAPRRRFPVGWLLAGLALAVVIAIVATSSLLRTFGRENPGIDNSAPSQPEQPCPPRSVGATTPPQPPGMVSGGQLAYPRIASPWSPPAPDDRVPFARATMNQHLDVEPGYDGANSWVASVLVGELAAGDGFFTPEQGSTIVTTCILDGDFYAGADVHRHDRVNKATTVDGHPAWLVETHLTFDIPKLRTKGETAIVLIVQTSELTSSIFYASLPDTAPQAEPVARRAMAELTVVS